MKFLGSHEKVCPVRLPDRATKAAGNLVAKLLDKANVSAIKLLTPLTGL